MENKVKINSRNLVVIPQGVDKLLSFKKSLTFQADHVLGATIDNEILNESKGIKDGGTNIPGYYAGTFIKNNRKSFFNIKRSSTAVVIELTNENYNQLFIGVDNPRELVDQINNLAAANSK
ncbi:hypothetical protein MOO44_05600 [Nicoliella spurrieriana]|uniref:Bacterial Pleckstrin homology domain-containing protein n=1 Tax=Nicoliella spurrieriana TaxID=2925830 RepID=A0A976RRD4_9LACO|nr:hypothetical protein [Nicoliella spurrieriana]UQS86393.1 hypothetical protein MOO44_05600 [Nicoliella spurrieriana]